MISWEAWALNGAAVARRLDLDGLTVRGASSGNTFGAITGPYDRGSVVDCSFERISNLFTVVQAGDLVVERCRFIDNRARPLWNSAAYTECLFAGNVTQSPLLITNERGLRNCTIVGNQVPLGGIIGVQAGQPGAAFVRNSVIVGNQSAGTGGAAAHFQPGLSTGTWDLGYSLISGWIPAFGGVGMVVAPPRFRDPLGPDGVRFSGDEDYAPAPGSPLIDAGGPTDVPVLALPPSALDLEGRPRRVDDPATPDTGPGPPPVIDIGALEFQG